MKNNIMLFPLPASGNLPLDRALREILGKAGYRIDPEATPAGRSVPTYCLRWPGPTYTAPAQEECWYRILFVRDLRDIAVTFAKELNDRGVPTIPLGFTFADTIEMVISHNIPVAARQILDLPKSKENLVIRYEEFVENPEETVRAVLKHCGVNVDDETIRMAVDGQAQRLAAHAEKLRPGQYPPYFDATTSNLFRLFLGKAQLAFGYRLDDLPAPPTPRERQLSFFSSSRRPYYIWAHSYRQSSAGIRCLHYLCHALNELGEEAYITPAPDLNPSLRTPHLTLDTVRKHFLTGRHPVALYPEVISGNPFATPIVARWLLNRPGHIGGDTNFDSTDLLFHFARWCIPEERQDSLILNLPTVDTAIFNNDDNAFDEQRAGACYYANKYLATGGKIAPEIENEALSLGLEKPRAPEELAEIFRQSEVLYCYELSSLIPEALSCGCPVLIVPSEYWQQHGDPGIFSGKGIELASTPGALAKARAGVRKYRHSDDDTANYYWWQVERFVATTQAAALPAFGQREDEAESSIWMLEKRERRAHLAALEALYRPMVPSAAGSDVPRFSPPTLGDSEFALIADRLQRPARIELIIVADEANRSMLSATLASIIAQQYPALSVTVVAPISQADKYPQTEIRWLCVPKDQWSTASLALQESGAEWCGIVRSGDLLVRGALALFACQAEATPSVRVLYSDECAQENADSKLPPTFRTAFDIDLVRAGTCIFGLLLAHKEAWNAAGGWRAAYCGLDTQDALLRLWETCGDLGIGHVAGALYLRHRNNRPFLPTHPEIAELRLQIVREHLSRSWIAAKVTPGQHGRPEHIDYHCDRLPKVSLIITTKDNREGLETCIRSIIDRNDYPDLEILVVDNGTTEASARAYLDHLATNAGDTIRVAAFNQPFNLGAMHNAAAQLAKGELLLFMHDDTEVLSRGWLKALATHCLRPGVAMAGALLVSNDATVQEAGIVAMQFGLTANPLAGMSLESEDPTGLLHGARQVSAISSACMMVRREVFIELGGMDAANFPACAADIDFCLKLRAAGHKIIWTPNAVLLHDSDGSTCGNRHDNNALLAKWGTLFTNDPCFNPWLALGSNQYAAETDPALQPDPIFWHPLPNIFAATHKTRIEQVVRCATEASMIRGRIGSSLPAPVQLQRLNIDVIQLAAPVTEHQLRELATCRQLLGCLIVLDIDPLIEVESDPEDPLRIISATLHRYQGVVDRFTTSSQWLAGQLQEWGESIAIIADAIDPIRWNYPRKYRNTEKLRIGWHGSATDLEAIVPVVMSLTDKVDWIFVGKIPEIISSCAKECHQGVGFKALPEKLASLDLDLAICPLAMNVSNHCRSDLPILEYGALGIPVIATRIAAYDTGLPITLVDNTIRAWSEAVMAFAADRAACRQHGATLREHVMTHRTLTQAIAQWHPVWQPVAQAESVAAQGGAAQNSPTATRLAPPVNHVAPRISDDHPAQRAPSRPLGTHEKPAGAENEDPQARYQKWLSGRQERIVDADLIYQNIPADHAPTFHLILRLSEAALALLPETLDSLNRQRYDQWLLDIVTPLAPPEGIEAVECIGWHRVAEEDAKIAIDSLVAHRKLDWIAELPSGTILDPLCLWRVASESLEKQEIAAFFVDDDIYDATGVRQQPRFKPGVNQEWLQSADLAGPLFVRRDRFGDSGGASIRNGSPWFDQLLRLADRLGWEALAHVPDVLVSYPGTFPTDIRSCLLSMVENLKVKGIDGEIVPATGRTWNIRYPLPAIPKVTVAILSQGQVDLLARCLECVIERTRYPDYEIVISVTDRGLDPELDDWLARARQRHDVCLRTVDTPASGTHAARCNAAMDAATSEFVLLLREEAIVVQANWLDDLVRTCHQPGVAAAGPRLMTPGDKRIHDAGQVLGLNGLIDSPYRNAADFDEDGYLDFLKVVRDATALPAACLLVRKAAYLAVGGMDEAGLSDDRLATADLCQKLRAAGARLVYQPLATLLYRGSSELDVGEDDERRTAQRRAEQTFSARWLKRGARDPFWNSNLSLIGKVPTPETDYQAQWQFLPTEAPRLLARTLPNAQGTYRVTAPLRALHRAGLASGCIWEQGTTREPSVAEICRLAPDAVIVQHYLMDQYLAALQRWRSSAARPFVAYSLDDLITGLDENNPARRNIPANSRSRLRYALERCDRLVVSTGFLAETYRRFCPDIRVVPNRLEQETWLPLQSRKRTSPKPRIGWAGGDTHQADLLLLKEVIEQTRDEADWIFFGMCPEPLRPLLAEYHELRPLAEYPAHLASLNLDLAVAPLADTPFNRGKSNLRLLEYGVLGIPVVCSDIDPYQGSPACRVINAAAPWIEAIRARLHDADAREQEGRALKDWVCRGYLLEDHLEEWLNAHLPDSDAR